jgi:hypothetical protein
MTDERVVLWSVFDLINLLYGPVVFGYGSQAVHGFGGKSDYSAVF